MLLNDAVAESTTNDEWNSTDPTTVSPFVFSVGNGGNVSGNGESFIGYCFADIAGYQKIDGYAGSNSSQTIPTGFAPRFVLIRTTSSEWWNIVDDKRNGTQTQRIFANEPNAESPASNDVILTSTGFTVVGGNISLNILNSNFIYLAIA